MYQLIFSGVFLVGTLMVPPATIASDPPTAAAAPSATVTSADQTSIEFPQVGLALVPPSGFTSSTSFHGLIQRSTGAAIILARFPEPFAETAVGFNQTNLANQNMEFRSAEETKIAGFPAKLILVSQRAAGAEYLKWLAIFGDREQTWIVTAVFPLSQSDVLSDIMRETVLAARQTKPTDDVSGLPFQFASVDGLVAVGDFASIGKVAGFTKDGTLPPVSPEDPIFIAAPSLGQNQIDDPKGFALERIHQMANVDIESITSTMPIQIGSLKGLETTAIGRHKRVDVAVYQVVLYPQEGGYVLMQGVVGASQAKRYVAKFKELAKSCRLIQP